MSVSGILRGLTLGLACLGLAACGNAPGREVTAVSVIKGLLDRPAPPATPDAGQVSQMAASALAGTTGQVIVVSIPDRDVLAVMQQIERNGDHVTFGTSDRRSMTLKNGILTATRGLGHDLMSVDADRPAALIRARSEGAAQRVNRYLDGEDQTAPLTAWCQFKRDDDVYLETGGTRRPVAQMLESCIAGQTTFQNLYLIDGGGRIVQSRQWISPLNGYVTIQSLR